MSRLPKWLIAALLLLVLLTVWAWESTNDPAHPEGHCVDDRANPFCGRDP